MDGDPPTFFFLPSPRVFLSRPFSSLVPRVFALRISSASVRPEGRGEGKRRGSSSMVDSSSELCSLLPFSVGREGGGTLPFFPNGDRGVCLGSSHRRRHFRAVSEGGRRGLRSSLGKQASIHSRRRSVAIALVYTRGERRRKNSVVNSP